MKYKILNEPSYTKLELEVNKLLNEGWFLEGQLQVTEQSKRVSELTTICDLYFTQVMVKYEQT